MLFLIDTCFWLHVQRVFQETPIDLRPFFEHVRWGYTMQVLEEYRHYGLHHFISFDAGYRIPLTDEELNKYQQKYPFISHFDVPDQTLAFCGIRDSEPILTDDGGIYIEMKSLRQKAYILPTFCLWMTQIALLKKKTCAQLLRFWEAYGLYEKQKIKRWKRELQRMA